MPRFFFIYAVRDGGDDITTHFVGGNNFDTLIATKAFVASGVNINRLLYISNVKEGTHHERLARGEVPPQAKSPYSVRTLSLKPRPLARDPQVSHEFVNAGIGLSPDSVCAECKGLASDHPDMERALSVMAGVRQVNESIAATQDRGAVAAAGGFIKDSDFGLYSAASPAPCEDDFQGGASGEAGPQIVHVDIKDFLTDEERQIRDAC